jgi:uncharacterized protein
MMYQFRQLYYPTILQAIHLLILYLFIQTVVDFPLALIDYYNDTDYLYNPTKKILLNTGSTLFILIYGIKKSKAPLTDIFPLKFFNPLVIIPLITFYLGMHVLLEIVNERIERVIPAPQWFWELFSRIFDSDYGWWGAFMKVVIMAPVIEELIFRGIILHGFRRNYSAVMAVFMSALLFSLFHLNPWQMPATFVLGLLLGWIMIRTRNIFLAILGHALNNLMVLLTVTFWSRINTHAFYLMEQSEKIYLSTLVVLLSTILIYLGTSFNRNRKRS